MQNKLKHPAIRLWVLLIGALLLLAGCSSEDKKENNAQNNEVIFSVALRDSETGTHYQLDVLRTEFTAEQASVLARLQDAGVRVTVSVADAPDTMTGDQRAKLIADVVAAYTAMENENANPPETSDPNDETEMQDPITLTLQDKKSGKKYSFTLDAAELNAEEQALVKAQAMKGALSLEVSKNPDEMTGVEKSALLDDVVSALKNATPIPVKGTVYVDAGHGFTNSYGVPDKGTGEGTPYFDLTGQYESDLNLAIAVALKEKLIAAGYEVIMIREGEVDEYLPINDRVRRINAADADIFISIHGNAASAAASGARVYWNSHNDSADISEGYAQTVADAINQVEGTTLVEAQVYEGNYAVVRDVHIPAVLVETCFLTNEEDAKLVSDPLWAQRMAEALCLGIENQYAKNG